MKNIALIFPGQGIQKSFATSMHNNNLEHSLFSESLEEITHIILQISGIDLNKKEFYSEKSSQHHEAVALRTVATSLSIGIALMRNQSLQQCLGGLAGHSLGEWIACLLANIFSMPEGLSLIIQRIQFMLENAKEQEGGMLAILGLDYDTVQKLCQKTQSKNKFVIPANLNGSFQTVVSGETAGLNEIRTLVQMHKGKSIPLKVFGAFHTSMFAKASGKLNKELEKATFFEPTIPIYSNVSGKKLTTLQQIKQELFSHMVSPVLWKISIQTMLNHGLTHFVEVGESNVLQKLIQKDFPQAKTFGVHLQQDPNILFKELSL